MKNSNHNYISSVLQQWMTEAKINNYQQLSKIADISPVQLYRLENGLLDSISLGILKKIAASLQISLNTLIDSLSEDNDRDQILLQQEEVKEEAKEEEENNRRYEYQQEALSILESLILQLPTFIYVSEKNPRIPVSKLIPLLTPLNDLLLDWQVYPIGKVGEIVDYNPQEHELIYSSDSNVESAQPVKIRYLGYRHQDRLLYRAKVCTILD